MEITVNGIRETLDKATRLTDFLSERGYPLDSIVIEHNGAVIPQPGWAQVTLESSDTLEILRFVGGG